MANPAAPTPKAATSPEQAVSFDKATFAKRLSDDALPPYGKGLCATYVRKALEAAGMPTGGRPASAKDYGPFLVGRGFKLIVSFALKDKNKLGVDSKFKPQAGDIVVIQGTSKSKDGHIAGWDGSNWTSDFIQDSLMPGPSYRSEKPSYEIYRR